MLSNRSFKYHDLLNLKPLKETEIGSRKLKRFVEITKLPQKFFVHSFTEVVPTLAGSLGSLVRCVAANHITIFLCVWKLH